ncbi:hypothetical protein Val02_38520 [Virgisporangium aliadipatigenens]|uniref:YdhG-like domain-containing protein n=1 Tax=Virgisporangium aliadipatigenens TaxID=741659 RepID=A0A8J3YKQ1_9ACTN|nr:DUF1801 domain-containing protein [Virgisporangium aliadipatigenens]GIJ46966.1 hypothetical protein Val02_38520 [Virgisporangium aliadipatigenens]
MAAKSVDEYVDGLDGPKRALVDELHALAREAVPDASVAIKWGHPAWIHPSGTILFMISTHAKHVNFALTPSTREAFDEELTGYETGKGFVKLPYGKPPPSDVLRRMIEYRVREHEDDGVLWM